MKCTKYFGMILALGMSAFVFSGCTTARVNESTLSGDQFGWYEVNEGRDPASNKGSPRRCAERVRQAGCYLSNNDFDRIEDNVDQCKQFKSGSGKTTLEVFTLRNSDKLVVVKTDGSSVFPPNCPTTKYTIDRSGIDEIKVVGNKLFMNTKDGQVYFMYSDESVYELLNSRGQSYRGVTDIKGSSDGRSITIIGRGFENNIDNYDLQRKIERREVRQLEFYRFTTQRSLFRDE